MDARDADCAGALVSDIPAGSVSWTVPRRRAVRRYVWADTRKPALVCSRTIHGARSAGPLMRCIVLNGRLAGASTNKGTIPHVGCSPEDWSG
jgi:hypothetical protein